MTSPLRADLLGAPLRRPHPLRPHPLRARLQRARLQRARLLRVRVLRVRVLRVRVLPAHPLRARLLRAAVCCAGAAVALSGASAGAASAAPAPAWVIRSVALPTNFTSAATATCESERRCDSYRVTATNVGAGPSSGTLVIDDSLPAGVALVERQTEVLETHEHLSCSEEPSALQCSFEGSVPPGGTIAITLVVTVTAGAASQVTNHAELEEVAGGGAPAAVTAPPATVANEINGAAPAFGVQGFGVEALDQLGAPSSQAGAHPQALTTVIDYTTDLDLTGEFFYSLHPVQEPKATIVDLPLGFVGDPSAAQQCPESVVYGSTFGRSCPADSQVGTVAVDKAGQPSLVKLYEVTPEPGYPAMFGFEFNETVVLLRARVLPSPSGYMLSIAVPDIPRAEAIHVTGVALTFFGAPGEADGGGAFPAALFSNPGRCGSQPLNARLEMDSWQRPEQWVVSETAMYPGGLSGCNALQFEPTLAVTPETAQADTPAGYEVALRVPQEPDVMSDLATPDLRDAAVTLPAGVALSPGAADGLAGCPATGAEGINIASGWMPTGEQPLDPADPEAIEIAADGLPHVARGKCPAASQIGTLEIATPLLREKLEGHVYVAQPECEPCSEADAREGRMLGLYLEAVGSGIVIKLKGDVTVDPATGQLTAHFAENPQLPFSELKLRLEGGARAPLANPQTCGEAATTSTLTPWSAPESGPPATPFSAFAVGGCTGEPLHPGFLAQSELALAGAYTPFTLTFSRRDGEQDLGAIAVTLPPGLLGRIAGVPLCGEPQAQAGTCPAASQIGTATIAAGAGSHPFWLSGSVYLTGPYAGRPFGLSVVVPERAGPFDLGEQVVRSAIAIDPRTAQLTVASDPLPQIKDGVPFRLKTVNVTVDRPQFIFNPTDCAALRVNAAIRGEHPLGSGEPPKSATVSSAFAAAGCKGLPFEPSFTASTRARTSRLGGASLTVKIKQKPGEANIAAVDLQLPRVLPSRLSTLRKACAEAQFASNPAGCPAESVIGTARAVTPVLQAPLTGPAYLVSHGGAAFPDVEYVLQAHERGGDVEIVLDGQTQIKNGITSSHFDTVPDAPIDSFETTLPEGPHSVFTTLKPGVTKLCASKLAMPTTLVGQNGGRFEQSTKIAVSGCRPITIGGRRLAGRDVTLTFSTTARGVVTVTARGLRRYRKTLAAGLHRIRLPLSRSGLSLRAHRRRIEIELVLRSGGKVSRATTALRL
jgi:hypothetical protein